MREHWIVPEIGREMPYWTRVLSALAGPRLVAAGALTLIVASLFLIQPFDTDFWSPSDIALAWAGYAARIALVAGSMAAAYTLIDEGLPHRLRGRTALLAGTVVVVSIAATALVTGDWAEAPSTVVLDAARASIPWTLLGVLALVVHERHRQAVWRRADVQAARQASEDLAREEAAQMLALLQAQIEPHFLFNTFANIRSLFRSDPARGRQMLESFLRYLRAALPRVRAATPTLGDEADLVSAYLDLFTVRMRPRLGHSIDIEPAARDLPFPTMMLLTLVENAVKHGVAPSAQPCVIRVSARVRGDRLVVEVQDDGVGLMKVGTGGTGVGLSNIRRQLAARYGADARLTLAQRSARGVAATIEIPVIAVTA